MTNFIRRHWADLLIVAFTAIAIMSLQGCVTRGEIQAAIWMNNGLDPKLCGPSKAESKYPELWDYGFYRRLDEINPKTGKPKIEFMPFCNPETRNYFGMHRNDFNRLMNATLPKDDQ